MSDIPRFSPLAPVAQDQGKFGRRIDHEATPRCYCGEAGPLDGKAGVCRACFRVLVMVRVALNAGGLELPENKL